MKKRILAISAVVFTFSGGAAFAATSDLTQTVNVGTLSNAILDASRVTVASPSAALTAKTFSFDCQASANASTGTLGSNTQRPYVTNGDASDTGFTYTIAPTGGATATWANGGNTNRYDYNDPAGTTAGCGDGADTDAFKGQMTIDPSVSTINTDCSACTATGITKGTATAFNEGTVNSVTLLNAGATSDDIWRGYLTGTTLSQTIPAETPADAYTLNMTLTTTAQ